MKKIIISLFSCCFLQQIPAQPGPATITTGKHTLKMLYSIPCTPVKDQSMSSTCWSFAGNSFLESELLRKGKDPADLSEMFTARMMWLRKINLYLGSDGRLCLTPGGQFNNIQWVLKNFGTLPEKAYPGNTNTKTSHDHQRLDTAISRYARLLLSKGKKTLEQKDSMYIDSVLDRHLGKLPASFNADNRQWTAEHFLKEKLALDPDDYIEITSYTHHPFYKAFSLENEYNFTSAPYMNVPLTDFMAITANALKNGYSVLWNGDATDKAFTFDKGFAWLEKPKNLVQFRQQCFKDSTSYLDHVMHITGLAKDETGQRWYYIKNSWGNSTNQLSGYMIMDETYFAVKTAAIVVNKEAIPAGIRKKMSFK